MNTDSTDPSRHKTENLLQLLRAESWDGSLPCLSTLASGSRRNRRIHTVRRTGIAIAFLAVLGGMAYAGIRIASRSWQATIHAHGDQVRVMLNGQAVDPDHIEWLPDGRCLVTVNGGRVLVDPKQPGGASATISVDHHDD